MARYLGVLGRFFPALLAVIGVAGCGTCMNTGWSFVGMNGAVHIGPFVDIKGDHHDLLQETILGAATVSRVIVLAPGDYLLRKADGIRIPSGVTLVMRGARIELSPELASDGQVFLLEDVSDVTFIGGEFVGNRDAWAESVNIAGIRVFGKSSGITMLDMSFRDLSSNAIGVFGDADNPIRRVNVRGVTCERCCNFYGDYLSDRRGPAEGSTREDQGAVALYHVEDWLVSESVFAGSTSDGTHFYKSHSGRFADCIVRMSQMGGYFLEACEDVVASGNLIQDNGSRGVTIERDSRRCTLVNNIIEHSGREGLWAPDVEHIVVTGNVFSENGRKDDGEKDCEIRVDNTEEYNVETRDILVHDNIFRTSAHQTAAIMLTDGVRDVSVKNNIFAGGAKPVDASPETLAQCHVETP